MNTIKCEISSLVKSIAENKLVYSELAVQIRDFCDMIEKMCGGKGSSTTGTTHSATRKSPQIKENEVARKINLPTIIKID
jgi:hypothetical protein